MAVAALAAVDTPAAAAATVALLAEHSATVDPASLIVAILDRQGGSAALTEAVSGKRLPEDVTKLAVRAVRFDDATSRP